MPACRQASRSPCIAFAVSATIGVRRAPCAALALALALEMEDELRDDQQQRQRRHGHRHDGQAALQ
jgi:hypothetical protein